LVHFWGGEQGRLPAVTELTELMARHAGERHRAVGASAAAAGAGGPAAEAAQEQQGPVSLVQLSEPSADGVAEFIDAPALAARYPDAFALRVDGDSMAPRVADGDLVVVSPSRRAWNGETAVVKLVGQIGATCKIYWRLGGEVHLIAANERYETGVCAGEAVQWALAVLCRVRVG
jgi:SOS-response transcriptional repressor LexA